MADQETKEENKTTNLESGGEEISKETLIQLLKDKAREIKTANAKLQKLENKYVTLFKDSKKYTKDRENFIKFLSTVFRGFEDKEDFKLLQDLKLGDVEHEKLQVLFFQCEKEREEAMNKVIEDYNKEKKQMEDNYKSKLKNQAENIDSSTQNQIEKLQNEIDELQNNNRNLSKEIIELNEVIQSKNQQLLSLEKHDDMIKKQKTEELINELQLHNINSSESQNINKRIQESEYQNKFLQLQKELDIAHEKIEELQKGTNNNIKNNDINNNNNYTHNSLQSPIISPAQQNIQQFKNVLLKNKSNIANSSNSETQTDSILDPQTGQFVDRITYENQQFNKAFGIQIQQPFDSHNQNTVNNIINQSKVNGNNQKLVTINLQDNNDQLSPEQKIRLNEEYLKNVILKYFEYQESRHYKEAMLLQSSIMTILRANQEERNRIEQARQKGSLWNATLSYIPFLGKHHDNTLDGHQSPSRQQ